MNVPDILKAAGIAVVTLASSIAFAFSTFATAADVDRIYGEVNNIEVRLIKQDIREIKRELKMNHLDADIRLFLEDQLAEAIVELCARKPQDKECK